MNNTQEKETPNFSIDDMDFFQPDDAQTEMIRRHFTESTKKKFNQRLLFSLAAALIVIAAESIARFPSRSDSIPGMLGFVTAAFLIYNMISYLYMVMKSKMNDSLNRYECVYGTVTEKYDSRHLSRESGENVPSYILFGTEQGHCSTALSVKNLKVFQAVKTGDKILVIKHQPMGNVYYDFISAKV